MLLVLASSALPGWGAGGFHLVGYSLGGGLAAAFARHVPHRVASLVLVAGGGLIRADHVGWRARLLYDWDVLPGWLARLLVRRRIRPPAPPDKTTTAAAVTVTPAAATTISRTTITSATAPAALAAPAVPTAKDVADIDLGVAETGGGGGGARPSPLASPQRNSDASGGSGFDGAGVSRHWRPGVSVSAVVAWQLDHHAGFVPAFLSTMRHAPIYGPQEHWAVLGELLEERRRARRGGRRMLPQQEEQQQQQHGRDSGHVGEEVQGGGTSGPRALGLDSDTGLSTSMGLVRGKVLLILGRDDPVVVPDETVEDAERVLGRDGVEAVILAAGHELPMTMADEVANCIHRFIRPSES